LDCLVSHEPESDEVVVLADDLAARPREVQGERGHVAAQVVHVENQILGEVGGFTPHHPADTRVDQAVLVPGRVDRLDAGDPEVPLQVGIDERGHETT